MAPSQEEQQELNARGERWTYAMLGGVVACFLISALIIALDQGIERPRATDACHYGTPCTALRSIDTVLDEHDRFVCTRLCDVPTPGAASGVWMPPGSEGSR